EDFLAADLTLSVDDFVPAETRRGLEALPSAVTVAGEKCPLDYEVEAGEAIVRLRIREHAARALRDGDLPRLDRRVAFTLERGKHSAIHAESLADLRRVLSQRQPPGQARRGRAKRHRRKL
ncbi:MAG TPA: hypothetical protein VEH83_06790, partial [Gemmatimonadales bacterium]|nr:hypothetical protein [Gemmatimonadales bacterium]